MRKIVCILLLAILTGSCGIHHKVAKTAGIYQSVSYSFSKRSPQDLYLVLKIDGTFIDLNTAANKIFRGYWELKDSNMIVLKCEPALPEVDLTTRLSFGYISAPDDMKLYIIDKNTLNVNQSDTYFYERVKFK